MQGSVCRKHFPLLPIHTRMRNGCEITSICRKKREPRICASFSGDHKKAAEIVLCVTCTSPAALVERDGTELCLLQSRASTAGSVGCFTGCVVRVRLVKKRRNGFFRELQGWTGALGSEGWRSLGLRDTPAHPPDYSWAVRTEQTLLLCPGPPKTGVSPHITSGPLAAGEQHAWLLLTMETNARNLAFPSRRRSQTSSCHVPWHWASPQAASASAGADEYEPPFPSFAVQRDSAPSTDSGWGNALFMAGNCPSNTFLS